MVKKKIMPFGICSFISLSFVLSFSPVLADSAYTLVETTSDDKSENVIVKYEYDNNTGLLTPKYYRVNLNKTEYGNSNGNQTLSFDSKYSIQNIHPREKSIINFICRIPKETPMKLL